MKHSAMAIWLNFYVVSVLLLIIAYLSGNSLIANLPALLIVLAILLTFRRLRPRSGTGVADPIAGIFRTAFLLLVFFTFKHIIVAGESGIVLALKMMLYHLVFLAGLMIGYYDQPANERRTVFYAVTLFIIPLLFFLLLAKGLPRSDATYFFNRNTFAGFTILISPILLGFGTGRQLFSLKVYVAFVSVALILNGTLSAAIGFMVAVLIYLGSQSLFSKRFKIGAALLAAVVLLSITYIISNPGAFQNIEAIRRLRYMVALFSNIYTGFSGSWLQMDMATAVSFSPSGELDMSAAFRILHWINIFQTLLAEGVWTLLIGGGTDWIDANRHLFTYNLSAHSEVVRTIVEQGLLHAIVVFGGILVAFIKIRRSLLFIPLFAGGIYFVSESAFNDFFVTTLYFLLLGYAVAVESRRQAIVRRRSTELGYNHFSPSNRLGAI